MSYNGYAMEEGRLGLVLALILLGAGCGQSGRNAPTTDAALSAPAEVGADHAPHLSDGSRGDLLADSAPPDAVADAPVDSMPVDTRVDVASDPPQGAPDTSADLAEVGRTWDALDTAVDRGSPSVPDGGCVALPAPAVEWLNPLPQGNSLGGVWGASATDVYAVGGYGTILHSADRGQSWQMVPSGVTAELNAVWGSGAGDVYVVGARGTILHSTDGGATWVAMDTGTKATFLAVWGSGPNDVYAVGRDGTIAQRKNQGAWTVRQQNAHSVVGLSYRGVYGQGGTVWVYGQQRSLLRSTDGGAHWTDATAPNTLSDLSAMIGVGGTLYLGVSDSPGNPNLFASTDAGATWNPVATAGSYGTSALAAAAGTVFAAGTYGKILAAVNGGTFSELTSGTTMNLHGAWAAAEGDLFAVGDAGVILHSTLGGSLAQTPAVTRKGLNRIWTSSQGDLVAIGALPEIAQSSDRGAHWTLRLPIDPNPPSTLNDLAEFNGELYAVGYAGILRSSDRGVTWSSDYSGNAMYAATALGNELYAVGFAGDLMHKPAGGQWTRISIPAASGRMVDMWSGGGEIWAVGGSDALHAVGGVFSYQRLLATSLNAIGGPSPENLVAAGNSGTIVTSTDHGATWSFQKACWPDDRLAVEPAAKTLNLYGVCEGPRRTFIVGDGGTVLVSQDHVNWSPIPSGTSIPLYGCTVDSSGSLYLAGSNGGILKLTLAADTP